MGEKVDDGGPAFARPVSQYPNTEFAWDSIGMTLLDYFAAQAMKGLLSNPDIRFADKIRFKECADEAYNYAIAMINKKKELEKLN